MDIVTFHIPKSSDLILRLMVVGGVTKPPIKRWVLLRNKFAQVSVKGATGHLNAWVGREVNVCESNRYVILILDPEVASQIVLD
jgi:hypothetical protein